MHKSVPTLILLLLLSYCSSTFAASFTSAVDGLFDDGATWGNTSPGVAGTDYPNPSGGDDFSVGHTVTIADGDSVTSSGAIATGGELVVNGTLTLDGDITLLEGATVSGTSGTINLSSNNIGSGVYYKIYTLDFNGTSSEKFIVNGPGQLGYSTSYNVYGLPSYLFDHVLLDSLTGFTQYGNNGTGGSDIIVTNSKFIDCTGPWTVMDRADRYNDTATTTFTNVDFVNMAGTTGGKLTFGSNTITHDADTGGLRLISGCTFDEAGEVYLTHGYEVTGSVFYNTRISHLSTITDVSIKDSVVYTDTYYSNVIARGNYIVDNLYIFSSGANAHIMTYGEASLTDDSFTVSNCVFEMTDTVGDGCDLIEVLDEDNTTVIHNNLVIDASGGTLINALGSTHPGDVSVYNNTVYSNQKSVYGALMRNETSGTYIGDIVALKNNLVVNSNASSTSAYGVYLDTSTADQLTYTDYNNFYNIGDNYNGVSITGLTEGVDAGFGASDIAVDPQFVDSSRSLATFDTYCDGAGTAANAIAELLKLNQSDYNSDYSITGLLSWVKDGFAPTNATLATAADDGGVIGAVAYQSATTPAIQRVFWW